MDQNDILAFCEGLKMEECEGLQSLDQSLFYKHTNLLTFQKARAVFSTLLLKNKVNPRKNWSLDQLSLLTYLVDKKVLIKNCKPDYFAESIWIQISKFLPGRSASNCKTKFLSLNPQKIASMPWTNEEQQLIQILLEKQGFNWKKISQIMLEANPSKVYRSPKQCRQHYNCFLRPHLKKGFWSEDEDYLLAQNFLKFGKKWSKISKQIEGRNQNAIKNRFYLLFQSKCKRSKTYHSELVRSVKRKLEKLKTQKQIRENITRGNEDFMTTKFSEIIEPQNQSEKSSEYYEEDSSLALSKLLDL